MRNLLICIFTCIGLFAAAQTKTFRFAFISDTHIGSPNGGAEEDLRRTVADINAMNDIAFVVITGDITELGTNAEITLAKKILDSLKVKYYIIPGNHDSGWSESGGLSFTKIFGGETFHFVHNGIHFLGCASGPYVRMSDGHVPRHNMNWLKAELKKIKKNEPVVFLNHYPLDEGLDNWYQVIDMLKEKNTILALCGHGHNNRNVKAEDIPAVMGRSNLRAKATEGGYNLVDVRMDSIVFTERKPVSGSEKRWTGVANQKRVYDKSKKYPRPDFSMNEQYKNVRAKWTYSSAANIISTPAAILSTPAQLLDLVVVGNQNGLVEALDMKKGRSLWKFQTGGPIFSSPAVEAEKRPGGYHRYHIVFGSTDGSVYSLDQKGKLNWKTEFDAAVLGSPVIRDSVVYIGASDKTFRALHLKTGKEIWRFSGVNGPVTSKPVIHDSILIFGAWDRNLYALNANTGNLIWKWNNGSTVINFSPAACIPVVKNEIVYIVAPDRYMTALDLKTGAVLWRTNESTVRESIGVSEDGGMVYGKTMQDTVVAFNTGAVKSVAWKKFIGYGYEHAPSMLIEKAGTVYFGTRNGIVYAVDRQGNLRWKYKIDNSMVNTVNVPEAGIIIASTMDGKISLLKEW
jgi:outer membrane protein assembly factor BamB/predicted phosphodiesterase